MPKEVLSSWKLDADQPNIGSFQHELCTHFWRIAQPSSFHNRHQSSFTQEQH